MLSLTTLYHPQRVIFQRWKSPQQDHIRMNVYKHPTSYSTLHSTLTRQAEAGGNGGWLLPCVSMIPSHRQMASHPTTALCMRQSGVLNTDLPSAKQCLSLCLNVSTVMLNAFFRWVVKHLACFSAAIKDPRIAFHELPVALLSWVSWLQSSLAYCRLHLQTSVILVV